MEIMRLIVTGAAGVGKTSLVRSVSDINVIDAGYQATLQKPLVNEKTTIAIDYGRVNFRPNMAMHLYGTPGKARFDFIWDFLICRAHASIVLVAANRPGDFRDVSRLLAFINARVKIPIVIGITHTDSPTAWSTEDVMIALGYANPQKRPMTVEVNPTQKASVVPVLKAVVKQFYSQETVSIGRNQLIAA